MRKISRDKAREYFKEAATLRRTMVVNRKDDDAAIGGREYRYFVDANVVAAYANPESCDDLFKPLSTWLETDKPLKLATITLMAEYMFSGKLPGQRAPGRLYMTPDHYDELPRMANAIARRAGADAAELHDPLSPQERQDLNARIEDYKSGTIGPDELLEYLKTALPAALLGVLKGPFFELELMVDLLRTDRVVRGDTERWFHKDIVYPDKEMVADWSVRLRALGRSKKGVRNERNLEADIRSIVQLLQLQSEEPDITYVLITADAAMEAAYAAYIAEEEKYGREPLQLNLRHPRDYVPLINLRSISYIEPSPDGHLQQTRQERAEMFDKIQNALDDFLVGTPPSIVEASAKAVEPLPRAVEEAPAITGLIVQLPSGDRRIVSRNAKRESFLDEVVRFWSEAARYAWILNANVLSDRCAKSLAPIIEIAVAPDVAEAALKRMNSTVGDLANWHTIMPLRGVVSSLLGSADTASKHMTRRVPLHFYMDLFKEYTGPVSINNYLDDLVARKVGDHPEKLYNKLLREPDNLIALLFGAAVALTGENWMLARSFAERAYDTLRISRREREEEVYETYYCLAVALRFTMQGKADYAQAYSLLQKCIARHEAETCKPLFRLLRDESEAAAVAGVFLYKSRLRSGFSILSPNEEEDILENIHSHLERAQELLIKIRNRDASLPEGERDYPIVQRVGLQVYANDGCLALYELWLKGKSLDSLYAELNSQCTELDRRIEQWRKSVEPGGKPRSVPPSVQILRDVTKFVLANGTLERLSAAAVAREKLTEVLQRGNQTADFDRLQYNYFLNRINQLCPEPPPTRA